MRFWVDGWDPSYGPAADGDPDPAGPQRHSTAELDPTVEKGVAEWAPLPGPADLRPPPTVLLVDGVRRIDARVWTAEPDGDSYPGLAASYAAGVVRCDLRGGVAELTRLEVERGLFTRSPTAADVDCGRVSYRVHRIGGGGDRRGDDRGGDAGGPGGDPAELVSAVLPRLTGLESQVAEQARTADDDPATLLVVDGQLRGRRGAGMVGYIKTHRSRYLPPELSAVVTALAPGQRSPVFRLGRIWHSYTWYLRLPGGSGAPWSGLARVECPVDLEPTAAVALADLSAVTLPRFAATSYKDPRAPQNLVPIAGLEQRLRARLGDVTLLQRALARAGTG